MPQSRLTRSESDKMVAGVCGGLATYLGIDPVLVRLAFLVLFFASGIGLPIYLVLWIVMPSESNEAGNGAKVAQENVGEMGDTFQAGVNRVGRHGTIGVILLLLGVYFLFNQLGWLGWLDGGIFWPLAIVGVGIYLLVRRRS